MTDNGNVKIDVHELNKGRGDSEEDARPADKSASANQQ
jgi:hypothetical protein